MLYWKKKKTNTMSDAYVFDKNDTSYNNDDIKQIMSEQGPIKQNRPFATIFSRDLTNIEDKKPLNILEQERNPLYNLHKDNKQINASLGNFNSNPNPNPNYKPVNINASDKVKVSELFNVNNISTEHMKQFYGNIDDKASIYVMRSQDKKFIFKNSRKTYMGYFSIIELIKYALEPFDKSDYFVKNIYNIKNFNQKVYDDAKFIIKNYVMKRQKDYVDDDNYINLFDFKKSPFMSDLQMLIYLNQDLLEFEKKFNKYKDNYLALYPDSGYQIISILSELITKFLSYTLKLITIISGKINKVTNKNNEGRMQIVKNKLYTYSLQIMVKISEHINKNFIGIESEQKKLEQLIKENKELKNIIDERLTTNIDAIKLQNELLEQSIGVCKKHQPY